MTKTIVRKQTVGEEIANSVSHGVGAVLSVAGTAVMIVYACFKSDVFGVVGASIFGFGLIVLYTMSTLYHALTNARAKKVFQILDHSSIFFLILGTYTPICLVSMRGTIGWTLFGVNAALTAAGVTLSAAASKKFAKMSIAVYLLMGWSVVFAIKPVLDVFAGKNLTLLIAGGLCYTVGVVFYKNKQIKFMHSVWHMFVLGGSVCHYFFILFYVLPIR